MTFDDDRTPDGKDNWTISRYENKIDKISIVLSAIGSGITKTSPDIIGLCEVENKLVFFMSIDNVKFRNNVVPGDTIIFSLKLLSPIRRGLCHMKGVGYVNDKPVIEAEMLAQISKKPDA